MASDSDGTGGHPLRALAHRISAYRRRAHRAVQLAVCAPSRRQVPAADRGYRSRALDPAGDRRDPRRARLARPRLGRRRRCSSSSAPRAMPKSRAELLEAGHAYSCYATPEELEAMRAEQRANKQPLRYDGRWRDRDPVARRPQARPSSSASRRRPKARRRSKIASRAASPCRTPRLDDFVLLRSDGTPTYMLAVVVDDHDMGVTHVIRGDDHLNNAFRQLPIIRAMGWPEPVYAHIPLIHGADGAKLSKRHGALGVDAYRDELGILPEALFNYLLRLGWGHGDDEDHQPRARRSNGSTSPASARSPVALRSEEAGEPQRPLYPRGRRCAAGRSWSPRGSVRAGRSLRAADRGDAGAQDRAPATSTNWPTARRSCSSPPAGD